MKNLVFVLAMVFTATITTLAQINPIQSRVVDINGAGVPDVKISELVRCNEASATKTYATDANGDFTWPQSPPPSSSGSGSSCAASLNYNFTLFKEGHAFTRSSFFFKPPPAVPGVPLPSDDRLPLIYATTSPPWTNVSAARFGPRQRITNEMIVAGFGSNLAVSTEDAQGTPRTTLAGRKVLVRDSAGVEKASQMLYVSPIQINYVAPEGLADGPAVVKLLDESDILIKVELTEIGKVSPGIFTANSDGAGPPAGYIVRVKPGNAQSVEAVAQFDQAAQKYAPALIDHGPEEDILILVLFGTGWRKAKPELSQFMVVGDGFSTNCPINYVGLQPTFEGLDQANVQLPRALIGKGEADLFFSVDGFTANKVRLRFK